MAVHGTNNDFNNSIYAAHQMRYKLPIQTWRALSGSTKLNVVFAIIGLLGWLNLFLCSKNISDSCDRNYTKDLALEHCSAVREWVCYAVVFVGIVVPLIVTCVTENRNREQTN